jgi:hypothetical protein
MENIDEILERKMYGIDCTEEESAEIKGYIRELIKQGDAIPYDIGYHFMFELVEVLEEDNIEPNFN